jgi:hypothetical protein
MAGEPVWSFRRPHFRFDPQAYAEASLHLGLNHPPLGKTPSGEWVTAVVEWEPGSAEVGDFTLGGLDMQNFVKQEVGEKLRGRFGGLDLGPVDFWQHPKLDKVKRPRTPRVLLPYRGPPLCYLYATHEVPLDLERSTVTVTRGADGMVTNVSHFEGLEHFELTGVSPDLCTVRIPRLPGAGLFFRAQALHGLDFWRLAHARRWGHSDTFFRDRVKRFIEEAGYTNVKFLEVGEIVDE